MKIDIDWKDFTIGYNSRLFFMKAKFENGYILAFYSQNPCGRTQDQDRGWIVFDPNKKIIIDECQTFCWGCSMGEYRDWIKYMKEDYGKITYFKREDGTHYWKMGE